MSTPFSKNREGRISHLAHLHHLLLNPIVITSRELLNEDFVDNTLLRCLAVEDINEKKSTPAVNQTKSEAWLGLAWLLCRRGETFESIEQ
jgi:hypothetical protein